MKGYATEYLEITEKNIGPSAIAIPGGPDNFRLIIVESFPLKLLLKFITIIIVIITIHGQI
jgi:hypothetical protein